VVVRENTEDFYTGIGGFFKKVFGGNDEKKPETQKQNDKK